MAIFETQVNALKEAGTEKIFSDIFSGIKNNRPQLDKFINIAKYTNNQNKIVIKTKFFKIFYKS